MIVVSSGFTRPASQSPRQNCRESGSAKNYALSGPRYNLVLIGRPM